MKRYRISVDDEVKCEVTQIHVEANSLGQALFQAGLEVGRRGVESPDCVTVVKIEEPAGWIEVVVPR